MCVCEPRYFTNGEAARTSGVGSKQTGLQVAQCKNYDLWSNAAAGEGVECPVLHLYFRPPRTRSSVPTAIPIEASI